MPYIEKELREQIDPAIENLCVAIEKATLNGKQIMVSPGMFNYVITRLLSTNYEMYLMPSYTKVNTVIGILECVKQEYYRKLAAPYEDKKAKDNGEVFN